MTAEIIIEIILFGIALAMDAFAVSVTDGLVYSDINKKKSVFIASLFGLFQGIMPLASFMLIEVITRLIGEAGGEKAGSVLSVIITWVSFTLLMFIGIKMLIEGIKETKNTEEIEPKKFSYKEVFIMAIATSIDAMAVGVTLHGGLSSITTIWLHICIIIVITFIFCMIGVFLGKLIYKLFNGKYSITVIIGGSILILLSIWVLLSHYLGI
ncbi:MAG: manganese efflux pump MntP family protein [Gammaproteobacteria bacterium]|nr:manganese efflux pump MntP family protein [Gammaproteobacteria bacterium]